MADFSLLGSGLVQGIIVGGVLAYTTATLLMSRKFKAIQRTANGWSTCLQCGTPSDSMLQRAACAKVLPATAVPQEAVYWTATVDGSGHTLSGRHDYIMHFPPGQ